MQLAKDTANTIYTEAENATDGDRRYTLSKWAKGSESAYRLVKMIELARSEPGIPLLQEHLDSNSMLLGVENGVVDLRTGKLRAARREDYITKTANIQFIPDAKCSLWLEFLKKITGNNEDLIHYLQRVIGYSLTGDNREDAIFIVYGQGANGKSTFFNVIRGILGEYARTVAVESLMVHRGGSNGPNPDLVRLCGARVALVPESEEGQRLSESLIKQLTGRDSISIRQLYCPSFETNPTYKIMMHTNHLPQIQGQDHAIWRRIHTIPFTVTIPTDDQDKTLGNKLMRESPGILNWAIEGCIEWQKVGLLPPAPVLKATVDYRAEMDTIGDWIQQCCNSDNSKKSRFTELYGNYKAWTIRNSRELKLDLSSDCDRFQSGLIFSQQHRPSGTDITNQTGFKKAVEGNIP